MPKGSFRVRGGEIRIRVGEPIEVGTSKQRGRDRLRELSRRAVAGLIEEEDAESGLAGEIIPVESKLRFAGSSDLGCKGSTRDNTEETKE